MVWNKSALFALAFLMFVVPAFSQSFDTSRDEEDTSSNEPTIEDIYLATQIEINIVKSQATSFDRELKIEALNSIERMIDEKRINERTTEVIDVLEDLGKEGVSTQVYENNSLINYFPMVRRQAIELLGKLGGESSKDALSSIIRVERDSMVLSEAFNALGKIGLDENNDVTELIINAFNEKHSIAPDDNLAIATMFALYELSRGKDEIDILVYEVYNKIFIGSTYLKIVRDLAKKYLKLLRK